MPPLSVPVGQPPSSALQITTPVAGSALATTSGIERAFAPFVQLDDDLSRQFDGSGLGLPLARLLTELHGGDLRLESIPGAGTTATLSLPAYAAARKDLNRDTGRTATLS